ncbi:polysaccharide deacetylase family protein [Pelotalea chapellei]|uniref:Polysaccharide deacetylase family protein n=1 Tax=Pelotalea chapellei TaxID=44671 RepID=A0ABS5U5S0_9BACT|nr:polysaccharide deacetylase family protein [Pelotalea chapellei]MBT1071017.1 polysaccharide deacetylase family protein [Pelotalea chapellei]
MKCFLSALLMVLGVWTLQALGDQREESLEVLRQRFAATARTPLEWSETATGVRTRLNTGENVLALTLDACGSRSGKGYDAALITYLEKERIPATLFINARWIDANPEIFKKLAANPLFEIANHGLLHKPASITGRRVYGIDGTRDVAELVDEIEQNARKVAALTGKRTRYYRSGTAYYDEVAVEVSRSLGHEVIGFSILGDAGATYTKDQVRSALLKARPGDIAILHMNHPAGKTADGVMSAIPELRRRGFRFVKLSEYELL